MTVEMKSMVELKDIKFIEFECLECRTRTAFPVGKFDNPPVRCAHCTNGKQWIVPGSEEWEALRKLGGLLRGYKNAHFRLSFEIETPVKQ